MDAPLRAYLEIAENYYHQDRLDLAMQVVLDAFESEGWPPGLWTEFYNALTCEKDARDASASEKLDDMLIIELDRNAPPAVRESLKSTAIKSRKTVSEMLHVEFARPVIITVFLSHAPVGFISGSYGYVSHKADLDKICAPHSCLRTPGDLENMLVHEFTHVAAHLLAGDKIPAWLNEGLATYTCGDLSRHSQAITIQAAQYPDLLDASHLEHALSSADMRKDDPLKVTAAYDLAGSLVEHWVDRYGFESVREALVQIGRGRSADRAIHTAAKTSLRDIERNWRRYYLGPNR